MARFEKGRTKTGGRVKGSPVTNSLLLKDAALLACQLEGDIDLLGIDLKDKRQRKLLREQYKKLTEEAAERGGLLGYFRWIAREHPTAMMAFLGRLLPFQVKVDAHKTVDPFGRGSETRYRQDEAAVAAHHPAAVGYRAQRTSQQ